MVVEQLAASRERAFDDDLGIDDVALREFEALNEFLTALAEHASHERSGARAVTLVTVAGGQQVERWTVRLRGVSRLTHVAAVRQRLESIPGCIAARVTALSSAEIRLRLTTSVQVGQSQIEQQLIDALREFGSPATFEVAHRSHGTEP